MKLFKPAFLLLAIFVFFAQAHAAEVVERIIAVVNDEIVTEQDLQAIMAPVAAQYRTRYTGEELDGKLAEMRQEFLSKVIEDKLILSEAKRKQVIVKDTEVDEMMADVRNKFPNREFFLGALEEQGLTEKKLWNRFRDQIMTQKLVNYEVRSKVLVSPGEINDYYKAHREEFTQGDRVRLQQILVRVGSRTEEEAKAFAESLLAQLKEGKPFEELAKAYSEGSEASEGGEMGWIEKGQLVGEIDTQVFLLSAGGVTPVLKSSLGFHIFKVVEKDEVSIKPLSDVRNEVHDIIFKEKFAKRLEEWTSDLKKNAYISLR